MKWATIRLLIPALLLLLLIVSGTANLVLYRRMVASYSESLAVRLDPANTRLLVSPASQPGPVGPGESRVVLVGDSRIALWDPLPAAAQCQILQRGVSGESSSQTRLRLTQDVLDLSPDLVVLQVGINDLKAIGVFPEHEDEITGLVVENLRHIADQLRSRQIEVVILTIFPPGDVNLLRRMVWSDRIPRAVGRCNDRIKALGGEGVTVVDSAAVLCEGGKLRPGYAKDTLHLGTVAYRRLNEHLEPVLDRLTGGRKASRPDHAVQ